MSYLRNLMRHLLLDSNLYENHLSRLEKKLFSDDISEPTQSNLSAEKWKALRGLVADKTIVIKGDDKRGKNSSVVVCDRSDYLHEASRQLKDQNIRRRSIQ